MAIDRDPRGRREGGARRGAARFVGIVVMYSALAKLWANELEKNENETATRRSAGEVKVHLLGGLVELVNVDLVPGDEDERGETSVGDANLRGAVELLGADAETSTVERLFVVDGAPFFVCGRGGGRYRRQPWLS